MSKSKKWSRYFKQYVDYVDPYTETSDRMLLEVEDNFGRVTLHDLDVRNVHKITRRTMLGRFGKIIFNKLIR